MSSLKQNLVEYSNTISKSKGTSNSGNLKKAFPSSPIHAGEISDAERLNFYQEEVMDKEGLTANGVSNFSMNYKDSPSLEDVETGGGGLPGSPFTPNVTSPGVGSTSAATQPAFDGEIKSVEFISNFGTGLGGTVSPQKTAKNIGNLKIGEYISGRSYEGSDGKS
jgi:hypothetical protein